MLKHAFVISIMMICSSCCTKKKCDGDMLPTITIQFSGLEEDRDGIVKFYTYNKGILQDSATYELRASYPQIRMLPFDTYENVDKSFVLKWNGKTETLSNFNCDFKKEKIKCNTCFLFIPDKYEVTVYKNFFYTSSSKGMITNNETLNLAW